MLDKIFLDTNILLYAYSEDEVDKQSIALKHLEGTDVIISKQVINELTNILFKKFKLSAEEIEDALLELDTVFSIADFDISTQIKAVRIKEKYHLQFYDSLIVATALENKCTILLSEDMHHNQVIDGKLTIVNPFVNV